MMVRIPVLAALAALAMAGPASAQLGLPSGDEPLVDELVVTGAAGPPWWRVSDGDTTLYIIADPGPIPAEVEWSKARLQGRVERANALILPPDMDIGLGIVVAAPKAFFQYQKLKKTGEKLEPSLPPPVRARFVAARERIGRPASRYGAQSPGLAGMMLAADVGHWRGKSRPAEPFRAGPSVTAAARAAAKDGKVRVIEADGIGINALVAVLGDLSRPGMDCLLASLDWVEAPPPAPAPAGARRAAVEAWAQGDVRPLLSRSRRSPAAITFSLGSDDDSFRAQAAAPPCREPMTATARLVAAYMDRQVAALEAALKAPGQAVAIVQPLALLSENGVLDRLRRKGYQITLPDSD